MIISNFCFSDKAEDLINGYDEETLTFFDEVNNPYDIDVYDADRKTIENNLLPYDWHKKFIVTGAIQNKLLAEYISQLHTIACIRDHDEKRRIKNYAIQSGK